MGSLSFVNKKMDKVCEFCMGLRPVIYCKADAAYLCLSCDAKVHSANALSNRHPRTLVCEACRYRPAHVRCSDHRMFMCHGCDCSLHKDSSQHQKQVISSFMGCPSAKDFAVLWGFELNELENSTLQNQFVLTSCVSVDTGVKNSNFPRQSMSSPQTGGPSLASQASIVTSILGAEYEVGLGSQHTELWSQNMQDLGICEELACINDFNIPDVDLTFQNFEEFFGCDQDLNRALFDDKDMTCSSVNKDTSLNGLDHSHAKEIEDASVASSVYITQSANLDKDIGPFSCEGCSHQIRPSYSSLSLSLTKFSAESNATDYMEGCFSPVIAREEPPCNSPELKGSESNTKGNVVLRHKDKKVRQSGKQNRYASHKARTDSRKRLRGRSFC